MDSHCQEEIVGSRERNELGKTADELETIVIESSQSAVVSSSKTLNLYLPHKSF